MLSAVACRDIFISPSMKLITAVVAAVPSDQGIILLITNYTDDRLHFGLAAERSLTDHFSKKTTILALIDDVAIDRSSSKKVGRRELPGNLLTMVFFLFQRRHRPDLTVFRLLGATAVRNHSYERYQEISKALNEQLDLLVSTLDRCHVSGRQNHEQTPANVGAQQITPFPPMKDMIDRLLQLLCDQNDRELAFIKLSKNDDVVLSISNLGELSSLDTGAQIGDRMVINMLTPFADTLFTERNLQVAIRVAESAAEDAKDLKSSFGRASYVELKEGDEQSISDPGAWELKEILVGIAEAVTSA
ncbi:Dak1 domain-containing protein [Calycina marina]|uniref:Dak1 domain-containing protein n=1 Tax=Calycina marina TaxID=1763456 RepID=A0A9P7Z1A7_9HELO|nr:Dak1 domain-containing protein [Calycina marina]